MREQLGRKRHGTRVVLGERYRLHECPRVRQKGEAALAKKLLDLETKWDASGLDAALPDLDDQLDTMKGAVSRGDKKKSTAELNTYLQMIAEASKAKAH